MVDNFYLTVVVFVSTVKNIDDFMFGSALILFSEC
jgi:hypothetical protein